MNGEYQCLTWELNTGDLCSGWHGNTGCTGEGCAHGLTGVQRKWQKNITQGWQRKAGIFIRTGVFRVGSFKQRRRFKHFLDTGIIVICFSVMIILITYINKYFFRLSTHSYLACQPIPILYVNMYLIHISTWIITLT